MKLLSAVEISTITRGLLPTFCLGQKWACKWSVYALRWGSPALTKLIAFLSGLKLLTLFAAATASVNDLSTLSCRQRYVPSPRAHGKALRMCFILPFLAQGVDDDISLFPQVCKFTRFGSTSYTDYKRNVIRLASEFQISDQVIFRHKKYFHSVHAPYWLSPHILHILLFSTLVRTTSWISYRLCFILAFSIQVLAKKPRVAWPIVTIPTNVFCLNRSSAIHRSLPALDFVPERSLLQPILEVIRIPKL